MSFRLPAALCLFLPSVVMAGPYPPPAGQIGSTAIANTSGAFVGWATSVVELVRGPQDIANPAGALATFGSESEALGPADGNALHAVSLGDGGRITLGFSQAITNGPGADFAVFENGFADEFLELALVEVSSNGVDFARFPAVSLTPLATQIGSFAALDATNLDNLAGKYRGGFGTPFDLSQVDGLSPAVDVTNIGFVRLIDVVGSIFPGLGKLDSLGNLINDPYPTAFASSGFDLDGIGLLHATPEPTTLCLLASGWALFALAAGARRRQRR